MAHILQFVSKVGSKKIKNERCKEFISLIENFNNILKNSDFTKMPYKENHKENTGYVSIVEYNGKKYRIQANKQNGELWLNNISYEKTNNN